MSVGLYFDHNARPQIADGLRRRDVDVLLAREDGAERMADERLLERATSLGRVVFTEYKAFLAIANRWLEPRPHFAGVIYVRQRRLSIGQAIEQLELIAKVYEPDEMRKRIIYLPL